jgi:hypothetical protein
MDNDTLEISDNSCDTITIDYGNMSTSSINSYSYGSSIPTITAGSSGSFLTSGLNGTSWSNVNWSGNINPTSGLKVSGDAEFEGKVMINGRNISEFMETISNRLAILVPDPAKLEHFAALKKAYEHYKTLEALCEIPKKENEE